MPHWSRLRSLAALYCVLVTGVTGCATPESAAPVGAPVAIDLKPYAGKLRVVQVEIGGRSHPFLFDTAGGIFLVTPKVAAEMGCEPFGKVTGFRFDGGRIDASRCGSTQLSVGGWRTRVDDVTVYDLMGMLQGAPEIGGLIGLTAFEAACFTLDLAANRLTIETPRSLAARVRNMREVRVRASRQAGGASLDLMLAVETKRGPIWLEIDSGNLALVLLAPHALEQLGVELAVGAPSRILPLNVAGLGPIEVEATAREMIYDGLLNAQFLEDVVMSFDLASMRAWMQLRAPPEAQ